MWFQASAAKQKRPALFWYISQRKVIIFKGQDFLLLKMVPIGCPEKSIKNYHYVLRNIPEQRRISIILFNSIIWKI